MRQRFIGAAVALLLVAGAAGAAPLDIQQKDLGGGKVLVTVSLTSSDELASWIEKISGMSIEDFKDKLATTKVDTASFNFRYGGSYVDSPLVKDSVASDLPFKEAFPTFEASVKTFALGFAVDPIALVAPGSTLVSFAVTRPTAGSGMLTLLAPTLAPIFQDDGLAGDEPWSRINIAAAPVPEPSQWLLMMLGAGGIALRRRLIR